ncbi:MAG: pullulanase-associated domain-containing protein [Candidatus Izemoplasmatales bacterium]
MKKSLLLLFFAVTALLGFAMSTKNLNVDAAAAGQVVFHYQKWDGVYTNVGLWVWGTGTGGTADGVEKAGEDDFGAYFEITIGDDATSMGALPISDEFSDATNRWNHKDTMDGPDENTDKDDLAIDVTAAAAGATMHVYFFSGSRSVFVASEEYISVFVTYFTTSEVYEENLGVHAWEGWYTDEALGAWATWGTPTEIFTGEFRTPEGKLGKVGMMQALPTAAAAKFLVYAGGDANKKTADVVLDIDALEGGDVTAVYVATETFVGLDKATLYAESSFAFKFTPYSFIDGKLDGTFALTKSIVQVKFSAEISSSYDDLTKPIVTEYQEYEIIGYNYVPTGEGGITIDDTVYDPYVATEIPAGMARVVFHYQKWDSDYSDVGMWAWNTGTNGTSNGITKTGVDDFGAVIEVNVGTDATSMGFIPIADEMGTDNRWNHKDSLNGADLAYDLTGIAAGEVRHVYFFSGATSASLFVADSTKSNFLVVYLNQTNTYEADLGIHNWNMDVNASGWGTPLPMIDAFITPDGVPGKAILLTDAAPTDGGIIVHSGDTKYSGNDNIEGAVLTDVAAGEVVVIYAGISGATAGTFGYTTNHDDFVMELMVPTDKVPVYGYVDYERTTYEKAYYDLAAMFTLLKDDVAVEDAIDSVSFSHDLLAISELAIEFAIEFEAGHEYKLVFDNGAEGLDNRSAEIVIVTDEAGPVITILTSEADLTFVAGTEWSTDYWPVIRAIDDRDGNVNDRIYVKPTEGIVNMNKAGVYPITVTAYDNWGNESQATFNITIQAPETGCAANNASIGLLGLFGVAFFFARRREWF